MDFRAFRICLFNWEYWPLHIAYLPVYIYLFWLSLRTGSFFYFIASNPGMLNGGMFGESKYRILKQLSVKYLPKSFCFSEATTPEEIQKALTAHQVEFPIIIKPDIGERGVGVRKITNPEAMKKYLREIGGNHLVQEFIDLPLEVGIFYYRNPENKSGNITSVVLKEMLSVTGDGSSTVIELIHRHDRAYLQRRKLRMKFGEQLNKIPEKGKTIPLGSIGNHNLGTKFLNGNHLISDELIGLFDSVAKDFPGFNYGRFDIRASDWDSLLAGDFRILELNGANAEPAHIYDPAVGIREAYRSLLQHWKIMFRISVHNHKEGIPYPAFREGLYEFRKYLNNQKLINPTKR